MNIAEDAFYRDLRWPAPSRQPLSYEGRAASIAESMDDSDSIDQALVRLSRQKASTDRANAGVLLFYLLQKKWPCEMQGHHVEPAKR